MYFKLYIFKFDLIIKTLSYFSTDCFLDYMCVLYTIHKHDNEPAALALYLNVLALMIQEYYLC